MDATLKIQRFAGGEKRMQDYKVTVSVGMTLLDALTAIKEKQDPTLSFTCSCRSSICGACAVQVNGNDVEAVAAALERTRQGGDKPYAIVLDTVKGAGVKEIEDIVMNHSIPVNDEKYEKWTGELKAELAALEG